MQKYQIRTGGHRTSRTSKLNAKIQTAKSFNKWRNERHAVRGSKNVTYKLACKGTEKEKEEERGKSGNVGGNAGK
jgi:hypothetical protein